jgi:uncharacterized protein
MSGRLRMALVSLGLMLAPITAAFAISPQEAKSIALVADQGNEGAQVLMAGIYLRGDGGYAKDPVLAAQWFERAAAQGNSYAQFMLGEIHEQGWGTPKNLKVAAEWREKAANRGDNQAQLKLAKMYLNGEGVEKDLQKAEYWLNRADIEGNSDARVLLAKLYRERGDAKGSRALADRWLAKAATQGYENATTLFRLIEHLGFQADETWHHRLPDLHRLAEDGDHEAQYDLAVRYEEGHSGETRNVALALQWFERAAEGGNVMAMRKLSGIYEQGLYGEPVNPVAARYWSERAASGAK